MTRRPTINDHLVAELGFRRALSVETYIMLWAMHRSAVGRDPESVQELAEAIGRNQATVYRWHADFRSALPMFEWPGELLDQARVARKRALTMREVRSIRFAL